MEPKETSVAFELFKSGIGGGAFWYPTYQMWSFLLHIVCMRVPGSKKKFKWFWNYPQGISRYWLPKYFLSKGQITTGFKGKILLLYLLIFGRDINPGVLW